MSLTPIQRRICKVLAGVRKANNERYVAGGSALNEWLSAPRVSHDIDLFHDTREALLAAWGADRSVLKEQGFEVTVLREWSSFVEAEVRMEADATVLQWAQDSAYRFFPLIEHPELGLALHPFDLATNKVLALIGRVEVRDWIDTLTCDEKLQRFGYLVWAACGKDPGLNPAFILNQARQSARYSRDEIQALAFDGSAPDPLVLGERWRQILQEAHEITDVLPEDHIGCCVLTDNGELYKGALPDLKDAIGAGSLRFHHGSIQGAFPVFKAVI